MNSFSFSFFLFLCTFLQAISFIIYVSEQHIRTDRDVISSPSPHNSPPSTSHLFLPPLLSIQAMSEKVIFYFYIFFPFLQLGKTFSVFLHLLKLTWNIYGVSHMVILVQIFHILYVLPSL